MPKVVIGPDLGGYALSREGVRLLSAGGCPHLERTPVGEFFRRAPPTEAELRDDYHIEDGCVVSDGHELAHRDCPVLVAVVEQNPEAVPDRVVLTDRRVVVLEIPNDVDWYVMPDPEVGSEHVAERHRTWDAPPRPR